MLFADRMDERGSVFPVAKPDVADLDRFMWNVDSPFERSPTTDGRFEIFAKGRSAIALLVWLDGIVGVERAPGSASAERMRV
jgi:hypothetical protein